MRVQIPNVCGECGRAYPKLSWAGAEATGLDCGHSPFNLGVRLVESDDYAGSVSRYAFDHARRAIAKQEAQTIESALQNWIAKSGLPPEEFAKRFGYRVERRWEGTTYHFRVIAVSQHDGMPVASFSEQPPAAGTEQ